MRKRRRTRYTWFPQIGFQGEEVENDTVAIPLPSLTVPSNSGDVSDVFLSALIPDAPNAVPITGVDTLGDFLGNEYFLKRIVGKLSYFTNRNPTATTNQPARGILAAGFFIARADEQASNVPIGAANSAERRSNYGPLNLTNTREPWIWRRTWVLGYSTLAGRASNGPDGIWEYGSVLDGGHIDAKTARRVKSDERLWFALQVGNADNFDQGVTVTSGEGTLDIRFLGGLRKARNRSVF